MITLEFRDALVNNRFSYYNDYAYHTMEPLGLYIKSTDKEVPYIIRGNRLPTGPRDTTAELHKTENGITEVYFANNNRQLNGRVLTTARIKEVLDGARCPLLFKIGNSNYLIGKGFLAYKPVVGSIDILFVATCPTEGTPTLSDIKFYVSKSLYSTLHKKMQPVIKDLITIHVGDVVITTDISRYIGHVIDMPVFKSITDKKRYTDKLVDYCIGVAGEKVEKIVKPKPKKSEAEVKKETKKSKEAEILAEVIATSTSGTPVLSSSSSTDTENPW